jgi:hypothetical protein
MPRGTPEYLRIQRELAEGSGLVVDEADPAHARNPSTGEEARWDDNAERWVDMKTGKPLGPSARRWLKERGWIAWIATAVVLVFMGLAGYVLWKGGRGRTSTSAEATKLILDPNEPPRAIAHGTYRFIYPRGDIDFKQPFIGVLGHGESCEAYGKKGNGGRFETPTPFYPDGTKLDHSFSGGVTIDHYAGPNTYTTKQNQLGGSLGARNALGRDVGSTSASGAYSEVSFTTSAEGAGTLPFRGYELVPPYSHEIAGQMEWTCKMERLKRGVYSINAY